eukprot:scaffold8117_cov153-Cylindrotheca_fusiformis.AAC.1
MKESYGPSTSSSPRTYAQTAKSFGSLTEQTPTKRPNPQSEADPLGKREFKRLLRSGLDSIYDKLKTELTEELKAPVPKEQSAPNPATNTATPTPITSDQDMQPAPADTENMSTNELIRQFMLESRASNQKLQEGQNGLYHNLSALDNKQKAAAQDILGPLGINQQLAFLQQEMQRMDSEHRHMVQQVARIDLEIKFPANQKLNRDQYSQQSRSSSSDSTASSDTDR